MFQVRTESALDEHWEQRNKDMLKAARRRSSGWGSDGRVICHVWLVHDFDDALRVKWRLELVKGVKVTLREHTSDEP